MNCLEIAQFVAMGLNPMPHAIFDLPYHMPTLVAYAVCQLNKTQYDNMTDTFGDR